MMDFPYYSDAQRGIPGGTSAYDDFQANISKMEKLVTALNEFHSKVIGLDKNHQDQVAFVHNTIQSLYTGTSFQGASADALSKTIQAYLKQETAFTGHQGDTSPQLAQATTFCQNTASSIDQQLQTLYREADQFAYQVDEASAVAPPVRILRRLIDPNFPSDAVIDASCALPPSTPMRVSNMDWDEYRWGTEMDNLGGQPLPPLPPPPTDPNFMSPPVNSQAGELLKEDIKRQLTSEGVPFNDSDLDNLIKLGYDRSTILAILRSRSTAIIHYAQTTKLSASTLKDLLRAVELVRRTINDAQNGRLKKGSGYHGRLPASLEQDILSNPDAVYLSQGKSARFIFFKNGNVVITEGLSPGRGTIVTSYGPGGPRGASGAASLGGSPNDPGLPVTSGMITGGTIPVPDPAGGTIPPATQILP